MRIFITLCIFLLPSLTVMAQETSEDPTILETPRQIIVGEIVETTKSEPVMGLRGTSEADLVELETEELVASDPEAAPETPVSERSSEPEPHILAPFYVSAADYLALRGDEKQPQLALEYEVTTVGANSEEKGSSEIVTLIIGSDYASLQSPQSQKIYDFKLNRYLEIKPAPAGKDGVASPPFLDNSSLYAKAYRNILAVRRATNNGALRRIKISEEQEIDAFWLESSMSWAAAPIEKKIKIKSSETDFLAIWEGETVASAKFSESAFENEEFKNSFFAFAHHVLPIHPNILIEFYNFDGPPKQLDMLSYGPTQPKGMTQKWVLKDRTVDKGTFPLTSDVLSAIERRPISPLVFVVNEAVHNRAMGGIASPTELVSQFETSHEKGDKIGQWLAGQQYIAYTGTCKNEGKDGLCKALDELNEDAKFASLSALDPNAKKLSDFINATEMAKSKKNRATALFTLQPYLDDEDTPAFILRSAAMARASMKKVDAQKSGMDTIQAEALLKRALAKDPYDPHTYVGLAQVYAAKGAFEQSWDIYDVLRAAIPTVDAVTLKIDQAESKLKESAPGYFLVE